MHIVPVKIERRPYAQQKSDRDEQPPGRGHKAGSEGRKPQNRIHHRAEVRERNSDEHDADVVKNTLEQNSH